MESLPFNAGADEQKTTLMLQKSAGSKGNTAVLVPSLTVVGAGKDNAAVSDEQSFSQHVVVLPEGVK